MRERVVLALGISLATLPGLAACGSPDQPAAAGCVPGPQITADIGTHSVGYDTGCSGRFDGTAIHPVTATVGDAIVVHVPGLGASALQSSDSTVVVPRGPAAFGAVRPGTARIYVLATGLPCVQPPSPCNLFDVTVVPPG